MKRSLHDIAADYGYDPAEFRALVDEQLKTGRARREAVRLLKEEEFPPQPIPAIENLEVRLSRPREPQQWRIEGLQPAEGRVILAAQHKAGKSSMVHNVVRSLVDGDKFLKTYETEPVPGNVTILDFELSEVTCENWLAMQDIKNLDKINLCSLRGATAAFNILDVGIRQEWEQLLAELNTDYLVLDCLRPVLDALGLDEHRDAGKFLNAFDALLRGAGVAEAMVVHHMGHGGERARGDSRILDWPDANWRLMRETEDPSSCRFFTAFGRDVDVEECRLGYGEENRHIWIEKGERKDRKAAAALESVLLLLREQYEPINQKGIIKMLGDTEHARQDIVRALGNGVYQGKIQTTKGQHNATLYSLTSRGYIAKKFAGGKGGQDNHQAHDWDE